MQNSTVLTRYHIKEVYTILDDIEGKGHYVGTFMGWGVKNNGWWGEGEIKFFIDNDKESFLQLMVLVQKIIS